MEANIFKIFELSIYFGFMANDGTEGENNENYDSIYQKYKENIVKNNEIVHAYMDDMTRVGGSDVTFDAGFDLFTLDNKIIQGGCTELIDYGINCSMKIWTSQIETSPLLSTYCGYYLYPRSSTGLKTPLRLANSVGIIDSGYRGNCKAIFTNIFADDFNVESGARYTQLCPPDLSYPCLIKEVNDISLLGNSERGSGGFGSTGK